MAQGLRTCHWFLWASAASGNNSRHNELARLGLDILTWPVDGFPSFASDEIRFLSALTGGFLVGWGVTIWMLSALVYYAAPEAVRNSVLYGVLAWFVFDSFGSITSGQWPNALWNVLVLLLVVGPMWWPAEIKKQTQDGILK